MVLVCVCLTVISRRNFHLLCCSIGNRAYSQCPRVFRLVLTDRPSDSYWRDTGLLLERWILLDIPSEASNCVWLPIRIRNHEWNSGCGRQSLYNRRHGAAVSRGWRRDGGTRCRCTARMVSVVYAQRNGMSSTDDDLATGGPREVKCSSLRCQCVELELLWCAALIATDRAYHVDLFSSTSCSVCCHFTRESSEYQRFSIPVSEPLLAYFRTLLQFYSGRSIYL